MDQHSIIVKPLLTEKTNALRDGKKKQYAFEVNPKANKIQIRDAVEKLFGVKTLACSVVNVRGKEKTMGMRGGRRATGFSSSWKKAYVTLAENQKIELFEGA
jgi:large subunit ribosomal protein L23